MRKILAFLCLSLSVQAFSAKAIYLVVDKESAQFTVSLPANPTTGYQWAIDTYDMARFDPISSQYVGAPVKRIGAGGKMLFVFELKKGVEYPTCTLMVFRYARPWEPSSGALTRVRVTFKKITQNKH